MSSISRSVRFQGQCLYDSFCRTWTRTLRYQLLGPYNWYLKVYRHLALCQDWVAFGWSRLLVLVFSFLHSKCGVYPQKLVEWLFLGAVMSSGLGSHENHSLIWKRYWIKVNVFWYSGAVGFQIGKLKRKKLSCTQIIVHGGTVRISEKNKFFGKCLFSSWNFWCN